MRKKTHFQAMKTVSWGSNGRVTKTKKTHFQTMKTVSWGSNGRVTKKSSKGEPEFQNSEYKLHPVGSKTQRTKS
jgi:hypothetical protein